MPVEKRETKTEKVGVNLGKRLLKDVDAYAEEQEINRTSAITILLRSALEYQKAMEIAGNLPNLIKRAEEIKG